MAEKQTYYDISGPFGLDRRDSAIVKQIPSILYELENFLIHNGNLEVREGLTRQYASSLEAGYRILALHRYYGLDNLENELKEFYAVVDGEDNGSPAYPSIKKYSGSSWTNLYNPPGIQLTAGVQGNIEQFKDRVYYTNQKEPVLMIKKEDTQIYEAGIPDADLEKMINDCETLTKAAHPPGPGEWSFYTDGNIDKTNAYIDGGFERHTEGDSGITMEVTDSGAIYRGVYQFEETQDLEWFYQIATGSVTTPDADGVRLTNANLTGSNVFTTAYLGVQIENTTDGSHAVITQIVSPTVVITTPLTGGTDNQWGNGDSYAVGGRSTDNDYIAFDIFRFNKIDIDELVFQFSSEPPNSDGNFMAGFSATAYADNDFEHWTLKQKTLMSDWVNNPYSNTLFFARIRKKWFIPVFNYASTGSTGSTLIVDSPGGFTSNLVGKTIYNNTDGSSGTITAYTSATQITAALSGGVANVWSDNDEFEIDDDWSDIKYMRVHMMNNAQSTGDGEARITIDNFRLLKTPPLPAELRLQVATCDAIERWRAIGQGWVENDVLHSTEGVSCKVVPTGYVCEYNWTGERDLSQYGEGTPIDGGDVMIFDIGATSAILSGSFIAYITLYDHKDYRARGTFTATKNFANLQSRKIHIQEFEYLDDNNTLQFEWERVKLMRFTNYAGFPKVYIDNIRIQPATATKIINRFMPLDLIIFDAFSRGIEHLFGENHIVDTIVDFLFHAYANFTRQTSGQGNLVYPEYKHGRYALTEGVTAPSLQMNVDAGGSFSVTFIQDDDLTEYEEFNFNMDGFWDSDKSDAEDDDRWGIDWVEIPASDNDEFSCWISTPSSENISHIIFRFYTNKNAEWKTNSGFHHGTGTDTRILEGAVSDDFSQYKGKRVRNENTGKWGIVAWVGDGIVFPKNKLFAWGVTWSQNDIFTLDKFGAGKGFGFNKPGVAGTKPVPDSNNYYEYVIDVTQLWGKQMEGVKKLTQHAIDYPQENEDAIEAARALWQGYGFNLIYTEKDPEGNTWGKALIKWKRSDFAQHFDGTNPMASWQSIAAHEIIVRASTKNSCTINFQDFQVEKKGGVTGTDMQYKVRLEDELGYFGPASEPSKTISAKGNDISLTDIVVPYDTRIKRKRLYRTDSVGVFRYLDTINREVDFYLDQIPEDLLGPALEEDYYRPPKARFMRKVDNRMAYIDCIDRKGTRRSSRIHLSLPFVPHQTRDGECFDLVPEDGQKVTWIEWYYGFYLVWKERSFYSIDPRTFEQSPRDLQIGCVAPLTVSAIPNIGFAWLSHEGVIFGDHSRIDRSLGEPIWDDLKDYTPEQLSHAIGFYKDRYYYIFVGEDYDSDKAKNVYNTKGYAYYVPTQKWTSFSNWNVQCVSIWHGGTDNNEIYVGSDYGYVNKLFDGETDISDDGNDTITQVSSRLRTVDFDLTKPYSDKYLNWIIFHAKNLSSDPTRKGLLTLTPYYDQQPTKALDDEQVMHSYYKKYDLCVDPGYEQGTTLLGFLMEGTRRYAIKGFTLDATDQDFRPFQKAGQY